jgi:hypothetical protein
MDWLLCHILREEQGSHWDYFGQPVPVPGKTRAHAYGCRFPRVRVRVYYGCAGSSGTSVLALSHPFQSCDTFPRHFDKHGRRKVAWHVVPALQLHGRLGGTF